MGVGGQRHAPAALPPERDPVPIVQEAGWAPGLVWTGAENLAHTGIRSPYRPARSELLYRLPQHYINLLKPTGHVTRQQFNIQQLYVLTTLYLCFVFT